MTVPLSELSTRARELYERLKHTDAIDEQGCWAALLAGYDLQVCPGCSGVDGCPECGGQGYLECQECDGFGSETERREVSFAAGHWMWLSFDEPCWNCEGEGDVTCEADRCLSGIIQCRACGCERFKRVLLEDAA